MVFVPHCQNEFLTNRKYIYSCIYKYIHICIHNNYLVNKVNSCIHLPSKLFSVVFLKATTRKWVTQSVESKSTFFLIIHLLSGKINQAAEFWNHTISMVTKPKILKVDYNSLQYLKNLYLACVVFKITLIAVNSITTNPSHKHSVCTHTKRYRLHECLKNSKIYTM